MSEPTDTTRIRRDAFPPRTQVQGMASQAEKWMLDQIEQNDMTPYEALAIVSRMLQVVTRLIHDDESETRETMR